MTSNFSRCRTCLYWQAEDGDDYGECTRQFFDDSKIAADEYEGIDTEADFGCVQHEPSSQDNKQ